MNVMKSAFKRHKTNNCTEPTQGWQVANFRGMITMKYSN